MKLKTIFQLNWWATLRINLATMPLAQALKMPVMVFGRIKINSLSGTIRFTCPVRRGIIRIGLNEEMNNATTSGAVLTLDGKWVVGGQAILGLDTVLIITHEATLRTGEQCCLRNRTKCFITADTTLDDYVRLSYDSQIMTSHFHYLLHTGTRKIKRMNHPVTISHHCWIGNSTTIMPGTNLPPYTTVASHSLVNKDFTHLPQYTVIGGTPARPLKTGIARIFDKEAEDRIHHYFSTHPDQDEVDADAFLA